MFFRRCFLYVGFLSLLGLANAHAFYYEGRANYKTGSSGATSDHKTGGASFSVGDGGEWSYTASSSFVLQLHTVYVYSSSSKATLLATGGTSGSFVAADGLTVSWTTDQQTDKKYIITFTGTAGGDPDPDPDPEPEPEDNAPVYVGESDTIYNGTDEVQTYIYTIVYEDGTRETRQVELAPGQEFKLSVQDKRNFKAYIYHASNEGGTTLVQTVEGQGSQDIPTSPDGVTTGLDDPEEPRNPDDSEGPWAREDNQESRHKESMEQRKSIWAEEKTKLDQLDNSVQSGNAISGEISSKLDQTNSTLDEIAATQDDVRGALYGLDEDTGEETSLWDQMKKLVSFFFPEDGGEKDWDGMTDDLVGQAEGLAGDTGEGMEDLDKGNIDGGGEGPWLFQVNIPGYGTIDFDPISHLSPALLTGMAVVREFILWCICLWFIKDAFGILHASIPSMFQSRPAPVMTGPENVVPFVPQLKGITVAVVVGTLFAVAIGGIVLVFNSQLGSLSSGVSIASVVSSDWNFTGPLGYAYDFLDLFLPLKAIFQLLVVEIAARATIFVTIFIASLVGRTVNL